MSGTIALLKFVAVWLTSTTPVPAPSLEPFRFKVGDIVQIRIYEDRRVNTEVLIDEDGMLIPPLLNSVKVQGMTVGEVHNLLVRNYSDVLKVRDPKLSVTVIKLCPRKI